MVIAAKIATILALGVLAIQDYKLLSFHLLLVPLLITLLAITTYLETSLSFLFLIVTSNVSIGALFLLGIWIYHSFKEGYFINPIDNSIGLGDVLFMLILSVAFNSHSYILFFLSTSIFGLLIALLLFLRGRTFSKIKLPFAGMQATFLALIISLELFNGNNLRYSFNIPF